MKTTMATLMGAMVLFTQVLHAADIKAPPPSFWENDRDQESGFWSNSRVLVGYGFGSNQLTPGNTSREEEGIDFVFSDDREVDAVSKLYISWWITEYIGMEFAYHKFGEIEQKFQFNDTRSGRSGS